MTRREKAFKTAFGVILVVGLLSPFILSWYWHFYWNADPEVESILPAPPACFVPLGAAVDGYASAMAQAWDDLNADGMRSSGEPPLGQVVVMLVPAGYVYKPQDPPISWDQIMTSEYDIAEYLRVTDKNGEASLSVFRPGCACNCWRGNSVVAWGPAGYEATTATVVALSKNDGIIGFGFRQANSQRP